MSLYSSIYCRSQGCNDNNNESQKGYLECKRGSLRLLICKRVQKKKESRTVGQGITGLTLGISRDLKIEKKGKGLTEHF